MDVIFPTPWASNGDIEEIPQYADANGKVSFEEGFGEDYEKSLSLDPDSKNVERKKLNYILNQLCLAANALAKDGGLIPGMVIAWPSLTLPEGDYRIYDGGGFNIDENPKLAAIYPSGQLPDLRGYAIRGLDTAGNIDPGRTILSFQDDAMQNITGYFPIDSNVYSSGFGGPFYRGGGAGNQGNSGRGSADYCGFDISRVVRTANETRMKNVALLYITKAG